MDDWSLEIVFNRGVTAEVFLMGLRSDQLVAKARPGQFVMIRVGHDADPLLRRPFSICGCRSGEIVLILYKVVGRGTTILSELKPEDRVNVLGPLGRGFGTPPEGGMSYLVGGGLGIAPLLFAAERFGAKDMVLLAGARTARDLISPKWLDLEVEPVFATDDGTRGFTGTAVDLLRANLTEAPEGPKAIFACGPKAMLKGLWPIARAGGIPCQVSLETAMACGLGACQGCAVRTVEGKPGPYSLVCREGPVFEASTLNWEAL